MRLARRRSLHCLCFVTLDSSDSSRSIAGSLLAGGGLVGRCRNSEKLRLARGLYFLLAWRATHSETLRRNARGVGLRWPRLRYPRVVAVTEMPCRCVRMPTAPIGNQKMWRPEQPSPFGKCTNDIQVMIGDETKEALSALAFARGAPLSGYIREVLHCQSTGMLRYCGIVMLQRSSP